MQFVISRKRGAPFSVTSLLQLKPYTFSKYMKSNILQKSILGLCAEFLPHSAGVFTSGSDMKEPFSQDIQGKLCKNLLKASLAKKIKSNG
jgi:hypothetical protein